MGQTLTEKIFARTSGKDSAKAGDELLVKPDFVICYDFPGYSDMFFDTMEQEYGIKKLAEPERFAVFIDHMVPAIRPEEEDLHQHTRDWCERHEVPLFERKGIGHQVCAELGYATPGAMAVHFDGHISQLGTFGTFGMGIRRKFLEALVRERVQLKVPKTMRVNLTGTLQKGLMARDVFHHIVRELGPTASRFQVMEIGGPGLANISLEGRQTINCLAMFAGAVTSIMEPDEVTLPWIRPRQKLDIEPLYSDPDADYVAVHDIDISDLEPIVVIPPSPANTRNLTDFEGTKIDVGYLGSCASGRLEDLEIAARILKGKKIRDGFQLHVVPTSNAIMEAAAAKGYLTDIIASGAFVQSSSCDYCFGRLGVMSKGQNAISTGTLNTPGRMGSTESRIFIANAASVAAAALSGEITDPRKHL